MVNSRNRFAGSLNRCFECNEDEICTLSYSQYVIRITSLILLIIIF